MRKNILVLLPTYNEAENIGLIIDELLMVARKTKNYNFDFLVIDDRSPDGTAAIVKNYQQSNKRIHLISGKKKGLGSAYIKGIKYGLNRNKYYAFITMDADFSHDPQTIPVLLDKLAEQNDCVVGSRYAKGGSIPGNWPLFRILNSRIANFIAKQLGGFNNNTTDITSGFRAITTKALKLVNFDDFTSDGYFFLVELLFSLSALNMKITEVPISFAEREHGASKISASDIIEFLRKSYSLNPRSRIRRLVTFASVGASGTLVNLITLSLLLKGFHFDPILSDAIAIELSIFSNFYLNNKYTFQNTDSDTGTKEQIISAGKFNVGALAGALISVTLFTVLFKVSHLNYLIADLTSIAISMTWNYWISVRFVWRAQNANS